MTLHALPTTPQSPAERMAALRDQARAIAAEQTHALEAALAAVIQTAEELRTMGDAVAPGVREACQTLATNAVRDRAMLQGILARVGR